MKRISNCRKREVIVGKRQGEEECMKTGDMSEENLLKKAKKIKNGAREGGRRSWSRGERK